MNRERIIEYTCDLVNIPTENRPPLGFEAEGQKYIRKRLEELGMEIVEVGPEDIPGYETNPLFSHDRDFTGRKSIAGIWRGKGNGKSVLLNGHMDVAPKEPMAWTVTEPFQALVKDGKIYGRGSADMKGGLVSALDAIATLKEEGFEPSGDIIFESVVDEEYAGSNGSLALALKGIRADFGIIMESTMEDVCPACVGSLVYTLTITGNAGMPYTGEVIANPILDMKDLLQVLDDYNRDRIAATKKPELWKDSVQDAQVVYMKLKAGEVTPHGQLSAPIDAWVEIVIQTYPNEKEEEVEAFLMQYLKEHFKHYDRLNVKKSYHYCPAAQSDLNCKAINIMKECVDEVTGNETKVNGWLGACDLHILNNLCNTPGVVFGPVGERLHGPDEWVDIDSLVRVSGAISEFIKKWCK